MDVSKIDAMLAQLQTGAARAAGKMAPISTASNAAAGGGVDFTSVLKKSLDHVNNVQQHATKLGRDFELGAPEANLNRGHDFHAEGVHLIPIYAASAQQAGVGISGHHEYAGLKLSATHRRRSMEGNT